MAEGVKFTDTSCGEVTGMNKAEQPAARSGGGGTVKFVDGNEAGGVSYDSRIETGTRTPSTGDVMNSPTD